jgi:hypothetical protein
MHWQLRLGSVAAAMLIAGTASALDEGQRIEAKSPAEKGGYKLESAVAIGGAEAPEEAQFYEKSGVTDVDADAQGNFYVLDPGGPRVQIFDAAGRFVRGFGKSGEGPGEMKMPSMLTVSRDGKVAVFDVVLRRITVYDAHGKLLRDQLVSGPVRAMRWGSEGRLAVEGRTPGGNFVEVYDADGKTVWSNRPEEGLRAGGRMMMVEIGNENVSPRLAFASNGDLLQGSDAEYGVRRLVQGKVRETWLRPYDRQARRPLPRPDEGDEEGGGRQMVIVRQRAGDHSRAGRHREDAAQVQRRHPRPARVARRPCLGDHVDRPG